MEAVTSLAEVWIEISIESYDPSNRSSLPLRKCGLKYVDDIIDFNGQMSLPLRKCGLKLLIAAAVAIVPSVTSLAEVWIEIELTADSALWNIRHFPCGSVD